MLRAATIPLAVLALLVPPGSAEAQEVPPSLSPFLGTWVGEVAHAGEHIELALAFTATEEGAVAVTLTLPVIHVRDVPAGRVRRDGSALQAGPFTLTWDSITGTLSGVLPDAIVPVHELSVTLRRSEPLVLPPRPGTGAPVARPSWIVDLGAPVWSDPVIAGNLLLVGTDDGRLHARDARTGTPRWVARAEAAIRAPVTVEGEILYLHADDGFLYRLELETGTVQWRVRTTDLPVVRIPPGSPASRWDTRGAGVAVGDGRLFVGTHDGRLLALDPSDGSRVWDFTTGGSVLATPAVADGRVFAGSYDGQVYALDAATGVLLWAHDTGAPVTSTPVPWQDVVVAGSRSYDLTGLDAATGAVRWNRYVWFSWIESTPSVRDGIAYVGSSDAAKVMAIEVATGRSRWEADVLGSSWGTPAVAEHTVYVGTRGQAGAFAHHAQALALDRASGQPRWRFPVGAPSTASFSGFAGSPAIGRERAIFAAIDGQVYAFDIGPTR